MSAFLFASTDEGLRYSYTQVLFSQDPSSKMGVVKIHFPDMNSYIMSSVRFMIPAIVFTIKVNSTETETKTKTKTKNVPAIVFASLRSTSVPSGRAPVIVPVLCFCFGFR